MKRGLLNYFIIKCRLRLVFDHPIDFIWRQSPITVAASDVGTLVSAAGSDITWTVSWRHRRDVRNKDMTALKREYFNHWTNTRRQFLAFRVECLLHRPRVETMDSGKSIMLGNPENNRSSISIGERGQRLNEARWDFLRRFFDLAFLRVIADITQVSDQPSKFISVHIVSR
ncbi:hypothetical protein CQR47_1481 [Bifidobacterium thermophilum]|uniref:Uncharacterized protein n=1 Tax=Bifidobacterium thermophilum TaxID=33905 RepID=A0A2N3QHA3_9BIFI|nr:hypothetical protein CQR48_1547 [Bifidobacterium thermophilum]PKU90612.1 hypothetical protein CQR47_1481 [Bifidobacterium thermophilum]